MISRHHMKKIHHNDDKQLTHNHNHAYELICRERGKRREMCTDWDGRGGDGQPIPPLNAHRHPPPSLFPSPFLSSSHSPLLPCPHPSPHTPGSPLGAPLLPAPSPSQHKNTSRHPPSLRLTLYPNRKQEKKKRKETYDEEPKERWNKRRRRRRRRGRIDEGMKRGINCREKKSRARERFFIIKARLLYIFLLVFFRRLLPFFFFNVTSTKRLVCFFLFLFLFL